MLLAAVAVLSGCSHKKSEAEQLGDLDKAYQGGAVTKQEYDAKKAAITGQPAATAATAAPATAAPAPDASASSASTPDASSTQPAQAEPEPAPAKGCEDAESRTRKDTGPQTRFYAMPVDKVKKAALDAFETLDFTVHSQDGDQIEASKKRHIGVVIGAGGERVTLDIEAVNQDGQSGTKVTGSTKKSKSGVIGQKSWTAAVLAQIACNLK